MKPINVGLIGLGTVGAGVVRILREHHDDFQRYQGVDLRLVACASREPEQAKELGISDIFSLDGFDVINNPDVDIIIELVGGVTIAKELVLAALRAGKHVVTANKALMATDGREVLELAEANGLEVALEASVGGGIPIIGPLKHSLTGNRIDSVMGIVNGTTNYMLTRMSDDSLDYATALVEAQAKGFAEANPSADVEGYDAAAKIAILASIAFNTSVTMDQVPTEGIIGISPVDLDYARDMGYCIKLLALAHRTPEGLDIRVHPTMLPLTHPLASVNGVFNAIYVVGDAVGETMFFGKGAGSSPAASAVVGDLIEVARRLTYEQKPMPRSNGHMPLPIKPMKDLVTSYYLRLPVEDRTGVLATSAAVFAKHGVSIFSVVQRGAHGQTAELAYVTHAAREEDVRNSLKEIEATGILTGEPVLIRVEDSQA